MAIVATKPYYDSTVFRDFDTPGEGQCGQIFQGTVPKKQSSKNLRDFEDKVL